MDQAVEPRTTRTKQVWICPKDGERQDLDILVDGGVWHEVSRMGKTTLHRMELVWEKGIEVKS